MVNPKESQCYVVEDFLTHPYQVAHRISQHHLELIINQSSAFQPTCFQLRSQSFSCKGSRSPRSLRKEKITSSSSNSSPRSWRKGEGGRGGTLQDQSKSFTFREERRQLGQPHNHLSAMEANNRSNAEEAFPGRRRLQELLPGDGRVQGDGWARLQSIRRRLQEKRSRQEKENESALMKEGTGSGWYLEQSCGTEREGGEEDFDLRPGGERRRLMRSTSLTTTPLSIRPAFPRFFSTAQHKYFPQLNCFYETRCN